jgi:hypothetical protein
MTGQNDQAWHYGKADAEQTKQFAHIAGESFHHNPDENL